MRRTGCWSTLMMLCLLGGASCADHPASAPAEVATRRYDVAGIEDAKAFERFFRRFQESVALDRRAEIALSFRFPVVVHEDGRTVTVDSVADFLSRYEDVFDERVRAAVLRQRIEDLFVNWQGVMVGRGEVWFTLTDEGFVLTVNRTNRSRELAGR